MTNSENVNSHEGDREISALDQLMDQQRRQLLEARMLPNSGPLTNAQRTEVRQAVLNYIKKHNLTKKYVSRQINEWSDPTINEVLKNTYKADPDPKLRALNEWMEVDARQRQTKSDAKFVTTDVAKRIFNAATQIASHSAMAVVHGPSGIGKTMVARAIADKYPGAIYLRISAGNTSYMALRRMISSCIRVYSKDKKRLAKSGLTMDERIFDSLRGTHRMLIIDEAHRIGNSALEFLRDLWDECQIPILLLATKDLLERIRADADVDHGQIYSRFFFIYDLTHDKDKTPGGSNPLFTVKEIRRLFESDQVRLDCDATGFLRDIANTMGHGSLRRCKLLVTLAARSARAQGKETKGTVTITAGMLRNLEYAANVDRGCLTDCDYRHKRQAATA